MNKAILLFATLLSALFANAQFPVLDWANSFGGSGTDMSRTIATDSQGNIITIGEFRQTVDFDPGSQVLNLTAISTSYFIQKLSSDGALIWVKQLDADIGNVISLAVDGNDNVLIGGHFATYGDFNPGIDLTVLTSAGQSDIFILKLNANGDFVWVRQIGNTQEELCLTVTTDPTGDVYAAGRFNGTVDFDPLGGQHTLTSESSSDGFVLKLTSDGAFSWVSQFPSLGSALYTNQCLAVDNDGKAYFTGSFWATIDVDPGSGVLELASSGQRDVFIVSLLADGSLNWGKSIGNTGSDHCHSLAVDQNSNVYLCGSFSGSVDFNPGSETYILNSTGGSADYFVLKLDAQGDYKWVSSWNVGTCGNLAIDSNQNVYLGGGFIGTTDFDPGMAQHLLSSNSQSWDAFYLKLDIQGQLIWATSIGSEQDEFCHDIVVGSAGSIYCAGYFESTCDFDPDLGSSVMISSSGQEDAFVMKVHESAAQSIKENNLLGTSVYPNPTRGEVSISNPTDQQLTVYVYDVAGHVMGSKRIMPDSLIQLTLPEEDGFYIVRIIGLQQAETHVVLKTK
jgi:hypothetical protein